MRRVTVKPGRGARIFGPGPGAYTNIFTGPITVEGEFVEVVEEDLDSYVQVKFRSTSYPYTYRDPSGGSLKVGDLVKVPRVNYYADGIGEVVALGRGNWDGDVKDIEGRVVVEAF